MSQKLASKTKIFFCIFLILAIFLSVKYMKVADESNWIEGGQKYLDAVLSLQPERTYIPEVSHRLGVTVLWISALIALFFGKLSQGNMAIIHRLIFLLINLGLFSIIIGLLSKYIKNKYIYFFVLYLFLNRFFFFLGRSTWLDQFLLSFSMLGILFWIEFLHERKTKNIFYSGFFMGMTLLTKYAGWFFPPMLIILTAFYCLKFKKEFRDFIKPLFIMVAVSLGTFVVFYPVMWVNSQKGFLWRFDDGKRSIQKTADIWNYVNQVKYYDPILLVGSLFVISDLKKIKNKFLQFFGISGLLYLIFFILVFLVLGIMKRVNYAFLEGIYRYTFPAIPALTLYTFARVEYFITNPKIRWLLIGSLFLREIMLSPIFNF